MSQFTEDNITFSWVTDIPHFLKEKGKNKKMLACQSSIVYKLFFESVVDFSKAFLF